MAAVQGYNTRILAGSMNLSGNARQASTSVTLDLFETTTFTDGGFKAYLVGTDQGTFSAEGPLNTDGSTNEPFDVMTSWMDTGAERPVTFGIEGLDAGDPAWLLNCINTQFDTNASNTDVVGFSMSGNTTGQTGIGYSLGLDTVASTGESSAVDFGAAGTNGAVFHMHVTSFASLTSDTIIVEGSANGSTGWATVASFTAATGVTSERVLVSGAVPRYLRISDTFSGSGSVVRGVAAAML